MKKSAVAIILSNVEGNYLLQLRDRKDTILFPNKWTFPGGFLDKNEKPEDAIKREIKEEMEFELKDYKLF